MASMTYGRGKEVGTVTFNLREQRCLQKALQTIDIEENYSLKLLDLDHRLIKVNHRKLKDRVSKIKSNLNADEIVTFREQESSGLLKPSVSSLNLGSARKIASASRRLNLSPALRPSKSSRTTRCPPETAVLLFASRPHSVSGAFVDAVDTNSAIEKRQWANNNEKLTSLTESTDDIADGSKIHRPHTTGALGSRTLLNSSTSPARSTTQLSQQSPSQHFSSHSARDPSLSKSQLKLSSAFVDDSIESNLGEDPFEERRQDMLHMEAINSAILEKRKEAFIKNVDEFMDEVKEMSMRKRSSELGILRQNSSEGENGQQQQQHRHRGSITRRQIEFNGIPTAFPEEAYKHRLLNLWKGMNKCRYLRVPDEVLDLSGVNTLASDQIKLKSVWTSYRDSPLC